MPATTSVGSAQHSLYSGGGVNINPSQFYQGVRNASSRAVGTLSKRAAEIMHLQNLQAQVYGQPHPAWRYQPGQSDGVAFGRNFTPTELSSGSMSTISDLSNVGSNLTGSALGAGAPSALSLGSSGMGPVSVPGNLKPGDWQRASAVSQATSSFMNASGLSRSLSFGDCDAYSVVNTPMSDASFIALLAEEKAIGDILTSMPPPMSSTSTSKSSSSQFKSGFFPSGMSVASFGSNTSMMNVSTRSGASDTSWLRPYQRSRSKGQFEDMWQDDRSMMSDVSESIIALDLALPS
jgi:hypothetical protein